VCQLMLWLFIHPISALRYAEHWTWVPKALGSNPDGAKNIMLFVNVYHYAVFLIFEYA